MCTGLCRIFKEDGYKVYPFKSQTCPQYTILLRIQDEYRPSSSGKGSRYRA